MSSKRPFIVSWVSTFIISLSKAVWALRSAVFVAVVAFYLLSIGQTQETYVSLASGFLVGGVSSLVLACGSLAVLCIALFLVARDLTILAEDDVSGGNTVGFTLRNLPGVLSLVPLVGAAYGLYLAFQSLSSQVLQYQRLADESGSTGFAEPFLRDLLEATKSTQGILAVLEDAMYVCAAIIIVATPLILWGANARLGLFDHWSVRSRGRKVVTIHLILLALVIVVCSAQTAPFVGPSIIEFIRALGPIFVLNVFLFFLLFFLATMVSAYDQHGFPTLSLLLLLAFVSSYWGWNDNHNIRLMKVKTSGEVVDNPLRFHAMRANLRPLSLAFLDWLEQRPGLQPCKPPQDCVPPAGIPRTYPVYIVAAEGGGMYAAQLTASVLARLYDRCPALRDHVFAITSVSGGSVGAGLIASLLTEREPIGDPRRCDLGHSQASGAGAFKGPLEDDAEKYLADDFLSPLGSAALFPDFFQRFFPIAIPAFDRAKAFEASLEATWDAQNISSRNPLRESFREHWRPDGRAPMLIFNTTSVENGQSVVVAPFLTLSKGLDYGGEIKSIYEDLICYGGGAKTGRCLDKITQVNDDMPLSTAIGLSARFPLLAPAGWLALGAGRKRYADGAYVENSGVDTALLLIRNLPFFLDFPRLIVRNETGGGHDVYRRVDFRLLILSEWSGYERTDEGLSEIMTPLRALYRARVQRSEIAINRARNERIHTQVVRIDHGAFDMALGWQLSEQTKKVISAQIGRPEECKSERIWNQYVSRLRLDLEKLQARSAWLVDHVAKRFGIYQLPEARLSNAREHFKNLVWLRNDNACAMERVLRDVQEALGASQPPAAP